MSRPGSCSENINYASLMFHAQYQEILVLAENPKTSNSMAEFLIDRYGRLGFRFDPDKNIDGLEYGDRDLDLALYGGDINEIIVNPDELFLLVSAREILRAQASRDDVQIRQDTDGTRQQALAHVAQKRAFAYVHNLLGLDPVLWINGKIDQEGR